MSYQAHISQQTKCRDVSMTTIVVDILKKLHTAFGAYDKGRSDSWVKLLSETNYTVRQVSDACQHVINTQTRFPSYADLKSVLSGIAGGDEDESSADMTRVENYNKITATRREWCLKLMTQEEISIVSAKWWRKVYGAEVDSFGLTMGMFEPLFLEAFVLANGDVKKALEIGEKWRLG